MMEARRFYLAGIALVASAVIASAIPAPKTKFVYTQPDGSKIELLRRGDEFYHWTEDTSGRIMVLSEDGYYCPGSEAEVHGASIRQRALRKRQMASEIRMRTNPDLLVGERHILVVLVNYKDKSFSLTNPGERFTALLNEEGYSADGGTGSVRDFYIDNSGGKFRPVFDVYGPVTLPENMAYYGGNDSQGYDKLPERALYDACVLLDDEIDFTDFDSDGDGMVDMVLFYYAGYNEAEGGSANTIWPHQWSLTYSSDQEVRYNQFDGVRVGNYFCTSEYKGASGSRMCGIGTTCHEFAHSLGLPDFYDTDYETNGYAGGLYSFSTMCGGPYNNESRTPPYFNAEERIMLGWMDKDRMRLLSENGTYSIKGIENNDACYSTTSTEGDYFVYEYRSGEGWDKYLPVGMVVYHVDKSKQHKISVPGTQGVTAYNLWNYWDSYNYINGYGKHPCFYVVPAADPTNLNFRYSEEYIVFPGQRNVETYAPLGWDELESNTKLSFIKLEDNSAVFNLITGLNGFFESEISQLGFTTIQDKKLGTYTKGDSFNLILDVPEGLEPIYVGWKYDSTSVSSSSILLVTPGRHTITAAVTYDDNSKETIELEILVTE